MDPITLGIGVIGLGMSLFGGMGQAKVAKQQSQYAQQEAQIEQQKAGVSATITGFEGQENDVRAQSMEMSARRSQLQTVRTVQRARAMSLQAGTSQGAQYGSGVQSGMGETTSEGTVGLQGISQSLQAGRQMFGFDKQITNARIKMSQLSGQEAGLQGQSAALGGESATYGGIGAIGQGLFKSAGSLGNIFGGSSSGLTGTFVGGGMNGAPPIWR